MAKVCSICASEQRRVIEAEIAAGVSGHKLANKYGLSQSAVSRHKLQHVEANTVVEAIDPKHRKQLTVIDNIARGYDVVSELRNLSSKAAKILKEAEDDQNHKVALQAIKESARLHAMLSTMLDRMSSPVDDDLTISVEVVAAPGAEEHIPSDLAKVIEISGEAD